VSKVGEVASAGAKKFSEAVSAGVRKVLGSGATRGNLVIGKVGDLTKAGALREGERTLLSELPNLGSPKANWAQNSGRLRAAMGESSPIRDATVDSAGNLINNTGFLRAERNLLDSRGWIYKADTTMWHPPMLSP